MKTKFISLLFLLIVSTGYTQTKVGTIDSELIVGLMPETKRVLQLLGNYANRLDSTYQIKVKDYQDKVNAFQKFKDASDEYKKIKLEEIKKLEDDLQTSQNNGNKLIQLKRTELMRPLYKKLRGVIEEVAKADGYTQIMTTTGNEFAYLELQYDITQKVMDKLGIKKSEPKAKEKK